MNFKLIILLTAAIFSISFFGVAQDQIITLWEGSIPNQRTSNEKEELSQGEIFWVKNVQMPFIEVYLPTEINRTGQGVVICPGGGYGGLAYDWEGIDIAKWFNAQGISAFVLKYRLPTSKSLITPHEAPLMDAKRAIRIVKKHAESWKLSAEQIGIMGFSAGGHLASTLAVHYDAEDSVIDVIDIFDARPNFTILIYPVITMDNANTHMGSRENLLGKEPNQELVAYYSNELHVDERTPPTFLVHSSDDEAVPVMNSLLFYQALQRAGVYSEMHIYPFGGHGYALGIGRDYLQDWPEQLASWLGRLNRN